MAYAGPSLPYPAASGLRHQYDISTPPPPPPKPSGNSSGRETPSRGPPLPPPPIDSSGQPHSGQYGYRDSYDGSSGPAQYQMLPPHPGWLPDLLQDVTTQDLQELVGNAATQAALLNDPKTTHPSLTASQQPLHQLLEVNTVLAENLQQIESRLSQQRSATQSRLLSLRALEQQHRSKVVETEDALRSFSPMALYQRLSSSVQEQDSLVKGIEDSFLEEGGMASERDLADFVRRVRDAKRTAFLRTERKERWDEGRVGGWR